MDSAREFLRVNFPDSVPTTAQVTAMALTDAIYEIIYLRNKLGEKEANNL